MASVYPNAIPMPMDSGKPIPMGSKEDMDMLNQYDIVNPILKDDHKENDE